MNNSHITSTYYKISTEGQTVVHELKWYLPDFLNILENKSTKELSTQHSRKRHDLIQSDLFSVKINIHGDNIKLYYLSPVTRVFQCIIYIGLVEYQKYSNEKLNKNCIVIPGCVTMQEYKWQYLTTMSKQDFVCCKADAYDNEYLIFQFKILNDLQDHCTNIPETQLSSDFESLLTNSVFSDAIMKSMEGTEYKVHKAVLASRSAVLKAHFEHNTTECQTNVVQSPLESEVLQEVLTFIYSDKSPRIDEMPEKLLAAADYYQLSKLKSLCEEAIPKKLTVNNAIEILQLADSYTANILKRVTLMFIKVNARLIMKSEGWAKLQSIHLFKTICEYALTDNL